jgi:hypothetical protein
MGPVGCPPDSAVCASNLTGRNTAEYKPPRALTFLNPVAIARRQHHNYVNCTFVNVSGIRLVQLMALEERLTPTIWPGQRRMKKAHGYFTRGFSDFPCVGS